MFNLEKEIKKWKKLLRKNQSLEDGYIAELESHLRDEIEKEISFGLSEEEAFNKAKKSVGNLENIAGEFYKSDTKAIIVKPTREKPFWMPELVWNYVKAAFRNFKYSKGNTLINIIGLALGISVFFLIIQYVTFELSYDSFHENADRIYRVRNDRIYSDRHDKSAGCPPAVAPTLKKDFPEVLESARLRGVNLTFIDTDKKISENLEKVFHAEPSFLKIFSFPLLKGSAESVLEEPYTLIISSSLSQKYFGDENPVNKTITLAGEKGKHDYKIKAVFEDVPQNSHVKFNILISYKTLIAQESQAEYYWGWNAFNTYILLAPGTNPKTLEAKFPAMVEKHKNYESGYKRQYLLQPVKDIHLYSDLRFEHEVNGSADTVKFLSIIAAFVLILAWVNYINLSTSRSLTRAKEVGVRKVLGSNRLQLIKQFMTESFLLNIIALILAVIIDVIVLPYFNKMIGKPIEIGLLLINHWALFAIMFAAGTFLSGIYPAFVMSSFSPLVILKTKSGRMHKGIDLRKGLVIFQFAVSIILITSTIIVYEQLSYMRNKNIGANIDQFVILRAPLGGSALRMVTSFKDELLTVPGIKGVCASTSVPGKGYSNASSGVRKYGSNHEDGTQGLFIDVDENYFNLFEIPLAAGRNFTRESGFNREIIINEEAVKVYGFKNPEDAVNKKLVFDGFDGQSIEIVGVTKNYHQESPKSSLQQIIFNPATRYIMYLSVKIEGGNIKQTIEQIKNKWDEVFADKPFEYEFLDEVFDSQYKADIQFGEVFGLFTFLAIVISCLGLFGLASYSNLQRTKEIGIRKVVGASLHDVLVMLVKDFTKWVLLANLIAWPVAYYFMNKWLEDFAYRIDITWWMFVLAGGVALIIALAAVGYQAIKAATANPIEALKYE
ncbi:MAG: ABC transporter permease [Ignavibacteria bacterium]